MQHHRSCCKVWTAPFQDLHAAQLLVLLSELMMQQLTSVELPLPYSTSAQTVNFTVVWSPRDPAYSLRSE